MTYRQILQEAIRKLQKAEIEEADNDAWILMSEAFNISRTDYFMKSGDECTDNARTELFDSMIERRVRREPLQYITGHAYFMGYEFRVTPDVLIPRFDTEILVEKSLKYASDGMKVLDMCTGSGCIAVSYALQCRDAGMIMLRLMPLTYRLRHFRLRRTMQCAPELILIISEAICLPE